VDVLGLFSCGGFWRGLKNLFRWRRNKREDPRGAPLANIGGPIAGPQPHAEVPGRPVADPYIQHFGNLLNDPNLPPTLHTILTDAINAYQNHTHDIVDRPGAPHTARAVDAHGNLLGYDMQLNLGERAGQTPHDPVPAQSVLLHELTHINVNETYGRAFVNYTNRPQANIAQTSEHPNAQGIHRITNEFDEQTAHMDNTANDHLNGNLTSLADDLNHVPGLTPEQRQFFNAQIVYAMGKPHIEYDTVINQMYYAAHQWGLDRNSAFYQNLERLATDALGRRTGTGVIP